jgi:hypothetical protein
MTLIFHLYPKKIHSYDESRRFDEIKKILEEISKNAEHTAGWDSLTDKVRNICIKKFNEERLTIDNEWEQNEQVYVMFLALMFKFLTNDELTAMITEDFKKPGTYAYYNHPNQGLLGIGKSYSNDRTKVYQNQNVLGRMITRIGNFLNKRLFD